MLPDESYAERNQRLFDTHQPVAMVTGSGSPRVGRRIAEYLLNQNFRVVIHAHTSSKEAAAFVQQTTQAGQTAKLLVGPVEDEAVVKSWVAETRQAFGRIDLLVNSAAIWEPKALEATEQSDFERFFRVNALGVALCCQHFGLAMTEQASGGAIINIGDWAIARPYRDFAAYFLSKGSLVTLTQSMAVELASRNPRVRVNAILPGPVKLAEGISPARRERIVQECLLRREGTDDDVAQAALFLATSPFVTGVCLPVDGGRSIYAGATADPIAHPGVADD